MEYRRHTPRRFALSALLALLPALAVFPASPLERTTYNLLGTTCLVRLYTNGTAAILDAAFNRIAEIDARMTINSSGSEVDAINLAAGTSAVKVTADVLAVIKQGLLYSAAGNGAFDITVQPLVKLWGIGSQAARIPTTAEIAKARALIDYRNVTLNESASTVFLRKTGMGIDLGSIAKGYAADEVARLVKARGVGAALIDLGGNVLTMGTKPDGSRWRIAIQNPEAARGTSLGYVDITGGSVTTAGTYERYFEANGKRYFHILDARTGYPAWNGLSAVAIVAPDSVTADGYDTLVFTLGLEKGKALVESTKGLIEAIFITDKHEVYVTSGLRSRFTLSNPDFTLK
jgi:FAD:protein FMN transferase